ncbi:MAG: hypothetical protein KDD36_05765 [Flavobacteriales bacterium]|nr:hypothetical protein [Flavobacteriales bacterium]
MKLKHSYYWLIGAAALTWVGCIKPPQCPDTPFIEYKDFIITNDSAQLFFQFSDGDGDIGLKKSETQAPYDYNLYMSYFEKVNGVFVEDSTLDPPFWYRVPYLNTENSNRCVKGTIHVNLSPFYRNFLSPESDTIMFRFYLLDRALNKSNIIDTPEIITP